jgi:hypothetical protein
MHIKRRYWYTGPKMSLLPANDLRLRAPMSRAAAEEAREADEPLQAADIPPA